MGDFREHKKTERGLTLSVVTGLDLLDDDVVAAATPVILGLTAQHDQVLGHDLGFAFPRTVLRGPSVRPDAARDVEPVALAKVLLGDFGETAEHQNGMVFRLLARLARRVLDAPVGRHAQRGAGEALLGVPDCRVSREATD